VDFDRESAALTDNAATRREFDGRLVALLGV